MKKAAVVIESWKLAVFKKILDEEGYVYTENEGPIRGCITLQVVTKDIESIVPVVKRMNEEAAKSKKH